MQGLSIGIVALFNRDSNVCRGFVSVSCKDFIGIDALFIGAPNVCKGFCLFLARTLFWYRCIVYWCSQCLKGFVSVSYMDSLLV